MRSRAVAQLAVLVPTPAPGAAVFSDAASGGQAGGDPDEAFGGRRLRRDRTIADLSVADLPVDVPAPAVRTALRPERARMSCAGVDLDGGHRHGGANRFGAEDVGARPGLTVAKLPRHVLPQHQTAPSPAS